MLFSAMESYHSVIPSSAEEFEGFNRIIKEKLKQKIHKYELLLIKACMIHCELENELLSNFLEKMIFSTSCSKE